MANLPEQVFLHYVVDQKINSQSDKETDIFIQVNLNYKPGDSLLESPEDCFKEVRMGKMQETGFLKFSPENI